MFKCAIPKKLKYIFFKCCITNTRAVGSGLILSLHPNTPYEKTCCKDNQYFHSSNFFPNFKSLFQNLS